MKIRNTFLLAVLLLIVSEAQANGASLNSLIEELAPIARLTNGIAIETELSADANKMNDVVAEFLRVGSGDDVAKLKELRVDEVAKELGELYATVEKVPELNVDMAALADTFKALETMKQGSEALEKNVTDPSGGLETEVKDAKRLDEQTYFKFEHFKIVEEKLMFIKEKEIGKASQVFSEYFQFLQRETRIIHMQVQSLETFNQTMGSLLKLQNISSQLTAFEDITSFSKLFVDNSDTFSSMDAKLNELKTGVDHLKTVIDMQKVVTGLAKSITDSSFITKTVSSGSATLRITVGFGGEVDGLKQLSEDLKSPKLKGILSEGKDMEDLRKSLSSLTSIHETLAIIAKTWSQISTSQKPKDFEEVEKILSGMSKSSLKTSDTTALANSLTSVQGCFQKLNVPTSSPDFGKVAGLLDYAKKLSERIAVLHSFLASKKSDLVSLSGKMQNMRDLLGTIDENSMGDDNTRVWNQIKNSKETEEIINLMNNIRTDFKNIETQNPFAVLKENVDLKAITLVLDSLKGTNLNVTLACLQQKSYDSGLMDSTLNFGKSVQEMKKKKTEVESVRNFLTDLSQVKTGLLEIQKMTAPTQKLKSRRRRAPKSLMNLKDAPTVAADLGKGVQVLREFAKILENEASVQVAVNADDGLKNAISAIPGVQSVWTDENRKGMGKMVVDLKELDKFAGSVKMDNMTSLWTVFDEARKVQGVEINDAKVFDNPISTVLASSSDPKINSVAGNFNSLGALNLDFSDHKVFLKAAALTLQPLQQFFDDYFGNTKTSGGAQASGQLAPTGPSSSPDMGMIGGIIGGLILFGAVGGVGYVFWKKSNNSKKWNDRERYWVYDLLKEKLDGDGCTLPLMAAHGRLSPMKRAIADGRYLDKYRVFNDQKPPVWQTPLHAAVNNYHPEIVELLIRAGANRNLWSSRGWTPEDLLDYIMKRTADEDEDNYTEKKKEAMKRIKAIFTKYKTKQFRPRIGKLMSSDEFSIEAFESSDKVKPLIDTFAKKFPSMFNSPSVPTTHYVCEINDDGAVDFDTLSVYEDDPQRIRRFHVFFCYPIPVPTTWLAGCLKSPKNFYKDYDMQLNKVKYNGKVYDTWVEWRKWISLRNVPCLYNVDITYWPSEDVATLETHRYFAYVVNLLGAKFCNVVDLCRDSAKPSSKPYWFPTKPRRWIVYQKETKSELEEKLGDWEAEPNNHIGDLEKDFVKFTVEEFFEFLLSLNGSKDLKPVGVPPELTKKSESKQKSVQGAAQGASQATTQASQDQGSNTNSKTTQN